ncbi:MAG: hypothetical protein II913_05410, partial [Elusimicrobiaceae bacterium]|nr:hypothetical protein [Elusimicrobiaceae bacterium]
MKLSINKFLLCAGACLVLVACSSKPEEQPVQKSTPKTQHKVEEITGTPAPKVTHAEQKQAAPKPAEKTISQTTKTLYPNEVLNNVKNWDQKLKFLKTHFEQTSEYDG